MKKLILIIPFILLLVYSCEKQQSLGVKTISLPATAFDYNGGLQEFNQTIGNFDSASLTTVNNDVATLGRVLFYDGALSINNKIACASCHIQNMAFTDGVKNSVGIGNIKTTRNSPTITNMNFSQAFFWDFQPMTLREQVLKPVNNHIEMGIEDMDYLVEKLGTIEYYSSLFSDAYGTKEITEDRISEALASFVGSIVSHNSKFDQVEIQKTVNYTYEEKLGRELFLDKGCNNCHAAISDPFTISHSINGGYTGSSTSSNPDASTLANIGLEMEYNDPGFERGMFKIPTMRNIALTAPYMHDGRFETLEDVIQHYNSGIVNHPELDPRLKNNNFGPKKLNMSEEDINHLVAFLKTFNDYNLIFDPKFSDPFER